MHHITRQNTLSTPVCLRVLATPWATPDPVPQTQIPALALPLPRSPPSLSPPPGAVGRGAPAVDGRQQGGGAPHHALSHHSEGQAGQAGHRCGMRVRDREGVGIVDAPTLDVCLSPQCTTQRFVAPYRHVTTQQVPTLPRPSPLHHHHRQQQPPYLQAPATLPAPPLLEGVWRQWR